MTDSQEANAPLRKRSWTSFSLRTALITITVFGVWLGFHYRSVRRQQAAVEAVHQYGGSVLYDYALLEDPKIGVKLRSSVPSWLLDALGQDHFHSVVSVSLTTDELIGRDVNYGELFRQLTHLPELDHLSIGDPQLTDKELEGVGAFTHLRYLQISNAPQITDQGVANLADLKQLEQLGLPACQLTDDSLRSLSRLPKLKELMLKGNSFTDEGLEHLRNMKQLRMLHFWGGDMNITNDGLANLRPLTELQTLSLSTSSVTEDGLRHLAVLKNLNCLSLLRSQIQDTSRLQKQLPNCRILVQKLQPAP